MVWFVFLQMWRWSKSGQVCSGKFLGPKPDRKDYPEYLIGEGMFLYWVILSIYGVVGLSCIMISLLSIFCSRMKPERQVSFKEKMTPAYEKQISH